jgi:MarR family transcriptional regulator, lower aerobic nicotinate degradation pathway regulator
MRPMNGVAAEDNVCLIAGRRVPLADRGRTALLVSKLGAILGEIADEQLAPAGLDANDYSLLAVLADDVPGTQQEIADLLGKVPGAIVALIDDLEERALVTRERDPADRRRSRVVPTRKGRAALAKADRLAEDALAQVLPGLSPKELEAFSETLAKGLKLP